MKRNIKTKLYAPFLTAILFIFTHYTYANSVVYEHVQLLSTDIGSDTITGKGYINDFFDIRKNGFYTATLTDFEFPEKFEQLGLIVTSSTKKMGEIWQQGSFSFKADAGRYYIGLIYETDTDVNLGMYGIDIRRLTYSAVPLPAPLWLMFSGLLTLFIYRRKSVITTK